MKNEFLKKETERLPQRIHNFLLSNSEVPLCPLPTTKSSQAAEGSPLGP